MTMPDPAAAYDPPGFLSDFDSIAGQREQWSAAVSRWFGDAIRRQERTLDGQPCQYFDQIAKPAMPGPFLRQEIVWNGFPGTLRRRYGRPNAMRVADQLVPLDRRMDSPKAYLEGGQWSDRFYRPQDEYCEWRVERDAEGRIVRVTFTSEPPEYWQALHGDTISKDADDGVEDSPFTGDPGRLLELYRKYVDPRVMLEDLRCSTDLYDAGDPETPLYRKGEYNPYNRWNTTDGIMHLTHPSNTLRAEITLGADATVLRERYGRVVADPDTLIARAGYGGINRCSDPTIGASVNHLAALGFGISLANPVGLYMDHLDMVGWTTPNGDPVDKDWFTIVRGQPGLVERAVFEVPTSEVGFTVSDLRIGDEPIRFGGQLAERMTVKLVGLAALGAGFTNRPVAFGLRAWADEANPWMVSSREAWKSGLPGNLPVYDYPEARSAARADQDDASPVPPRRPWSRAS